MSTLPALRLSSVRDSVADLLRNALLEGKFRPGESLSEPSLAAQLGVSRGPVREALLVLEQEGLVVHSQNRGFSVLSIGAEDHRAMTVVRLPLETLALELARGRATEEDLLELDAIARRLVETFGTDPSLSAREDLAFHEKVWEVSGNQWLIVALRRIVVPFFTFTMIFRAGSERLTPKVLEDQHQAYIDFLRGKTEMTAEQCVRHHLRMYAA